MTDPYIGEVRMFGGNFAPVGWLFCQGQSLPIAQYDALFNLIGTTYGGDGQTTFAVPNLQGRLPAHVGSGRVLGQVGGVESVRLTSNEMPAHTHQLNASAGPSDSTSPTSKVWAPGADLPYSAGPPNATMNPAALQSTGGNQPHENMPPFLAVNFIIATEGIYPPPS